RREDYHPADLWEVGPGERLLAGPVLLRDSRNGLERLAVWLAHGPTGVTLWAAPLLVTHGRTPAPRRYSLEAPGPAPAPERDGRAVLIRVPLDNRDGVLLVTGQGLWLLDPAPRGGPGERDPAADGRRPLPAVCLLSGRPLHVSAHGI